MTVALLHGFAGAPEAWHDVIAAWPETLAAPTAIALPGHGGGDVRATWEANLDVIAERVRTVGARIVVGYSLGARCALGLVARDPQLRAILISVNPGIPDDERAARRTQDAAWAARLRSDGVDAFLAAWQAQPLFATQARVPEQTRAQRLAWRSRLDPEQLARSLEVMGLAQMPDYRAPLAALVPRVSLVVGADDAKFVAIARTYAAVPRIEIQTAATTRRWNARASSRTRSLRCYENAVRRSSGMRRGRPLANATNAHVVAARATIWVPRAISVRRTHDAARQLSTHVVATSSSPIVTCAR